MKKYQLQLFLLSKWIILKGYALKSIKNKQFVKIWKSYFLKKKKKTISKSYITINNYFVTVSL